MSTADSLTARPAKSQDTAGRRFSRAAAATLVLVLLVIAAGSIVRITGSGMGCPDWPTCFGRLIPPTDVSQLPADYATRYALPGHVPVFNAVQTWVEYINRLVGALSGLAGLVMVATGLPCWRIEPRRVAAAVAALLLIGVNAWLGKLVVDSVLLQGMVTVHLAAAWAVVAALVVALWQPQRRPWSSAVARTQTQIVVVSVLGLALVQLLAGAHLRESIEANALRLGTADRQAWLDSAGGELIVHRALPVALAVGFLWAYRVLALSGLWPFVRRWYRLAMLCAVANAVVGLVLAYGALPPWAQPLHLVFATGMIAALSAVAAAAFDPTEHVG